MHVSHLKVVHVFFFVAHTVLWNAATGDSKIQGRHDISTRISTSCPLRRSDPAENVLHKIRRFLQDRSPLDSAFQEAGRINSIRQTLAGQHLQATAILIEPSVVLDGNGTPLGGYGYELLRNSARFYNFTYTLEIPTFKGTVRLKNGSFVGPIGQVSSGQKDLILVCGQTLERNSQLDFTSYLEVTELKFITSHPRQELRWEAILFIFPPLVWALLLLSSSIMVAVFCVFAKSNKNEGQDKVSHEAVYHALVVTFCPFLEQGTHFYPQTFPRRLILFLWLSNCLTITAFYKSDFSAYLTFPLYEEIPQNFKQLSENPSFNVNFMFINAAGAAFFNNSESVMYKGLRERFIWEKNKLTCIQSVIFGKKTVCVGFGAIIAVEAAKNLTIQRESLPFRYSKDTALSLHLNMGFRKGSRYVQSFNQIVGPLRETGIIRKWKNDGFNIRRTQGMKWIRTEEAGQLQDLLKTQMETQSGSNVKPLGVKNVFCGLLILFVGLFLAFFVYFTEIIIWKYYGRLDEVPPSIVLEVTVAKLSKHDP